MSFKVFLNMCPRNALTCCMITSLLPVSHVTFPGSQRAPLLCNMPTRVIQSLQLSNYDLFSAFQELIPAAPLLYFRCPVISAQNPPFESCVGTPL